ncbi:MAG: protein kinase [Deltaproteobacteria bacterium]|nr:protein kinase [Deltaproteobacteria bacterium]MBN2673636.1 protein kinase [Deltaproteobacteria bacterium]
MAEETLCPKCNAINPGDTAFCSKCGTALGGTTSGDKEDPFIGSFVGERFLVKRKLGEGGMGVVYEAEQTAMDRKVALKVLHPHLNDDELYARFRNEAAASSKLEHPNIITVYDFGRTENDSLYIAMEFISGKSLDDEIKENGAMDWQRACRIGSQICGALRNAHEKSIIHRDMKPENVMLCRRGDEVDFVKVLDFGIAKLMDDGATDQRKALTKTGMVFGTPQYMSPEQVRGEKLDARSDIYSVGIIMYEMLTGSLPFTADTPMGLLTKHLMDTPPAFNAINPNAGVPPELEAVVMGALSKSADDRPQTMKEFRAALDRLIGIEHSGKTTVAAVVNSGAATSAQTQKSAATMPMPATSAPTPVVRQKSSSPVIGIIAGVMVLLVAGGGAAWYFLMGPGVATPDTTVPVTNTVETVSTSGQSTADDTPPEAGDDNAPPGPESLSANPEGDIVANEPAGSSSSGGTASKIQQAKQSIGNGNLNNVNVSAETKKKLEEAAKNGKIPEGTEIPAGVTIPEGMKEKLESQLGAQASGRCMVNANGGKDATTVSRALKTKQSALKACIQDGTNVAAVSFSLTEGQKTLSGISTKNGNAAQANCLKAILSGLKLSAPSGKDATGTVRFNTEKSGSEVTKCVGIVRL